MALPINIDARLESIIDSLNALVDEMDSDDSNSAEEYAIYNDLAASATYARAATLKCERVQAAHTKQAR